MYGFLLICLGFTPIVWVARRNFYLQKAGRTEPVPETFGKAVMQRLLGTLIGFGAVIAIFVGVLLMVAGI